MCGIVGAVAKQDILPILMNGLRQLEYRGYDSSGVALLSDDEIHLRRAVGKVIELEKTLRDYPVKGNTGIAHTRWATHGVPSEKNAHPHISSSVAVVCNGIIENHEELRQNQIKLGYTFNSDTDTEVVVNQITHYIKTEK